MYKSGFCRKEVYRYYDKFSYLGKYYNHDVWTDKAVADIACIKINIKHDAEYRDWETDRKSTPLNSSHRSLSRMPSSA